MVEVPWTLGRSGPTISGLASTVKSGITAETVTGASRVVVSPVPGSTLAYPPRIVTDPAWVTVMATFTEQLVPPVMHGLVPLTVALSPGLATVVKVMESVLNPGQPFCAVAVIVTLRVKGGVFGPIRVWFAEIEMKGGEALLLKKPFCAVSWSFSLTPDIIVMQTPPGTLVFVQPVWKLTGIPLDWVCPVIL